MSFFAELKRRNVFKVAAAYIIVGWLIMQAGEVMAPALRLPDWINSALAFFLILGFPLALFFAWAFEMTPEGIRKEKDVDRSQSITHATGQKLNYSIIALLIIALAYFVWESRFQARDVDPASSDVELVEVPSDAQTKSDVSAETRDQQTADKNSIAVLPFINMSDDASNEFFSDGITEELLNLLAKIPDLKVTSRSSVFSFKGQNPDIPTVAKKLNVAHVLEGSVRKAGNRVRITAQLIKADTDVHIWSETYDRELNDVFAIQDEISREVVNALQIKLLGEAPRVISTDTEAYTLYLRGKYLEAQDNRESWEAAESTFRAAIEIDPEYAPAWSGLSVALGSLANFGYIDLHEGMEAARQASVHALELDDSLAEAWASLAHIQQAFDWNWSRAEGSVRTALQYGPRNVIALEAAATILRGLGRFDEATHYAQQSVELDPLSISSLRTLAITYWASGRYPDAQEVLQQILELYPEQVSVKAFLAAQSLLQEKPEEALLYLLNDSDNIWQRLVSTMVLYTLDHQDESNRKLQQLIENDNDVWAFQIGEIHAWRGNPDAAFEALERAYENKDGGFTQVLYSPYLVTLHDDPRWERILDKVGLLKYWQEMQTRQGESAS
jgi:TolB-like protein/Tfp pilus assembly protein PilF